MNNEDLFGCNNCDREFNDLLLRAKLIVLYIHFLRSIGMQFTLFYTNHSRPLVPDGVHGFFNEF